jgi:hypothetical protein
VIVTPTTTVPEGEEHIAVDPNNYQNLVAVVSDFALRGGYNTTKYAVSADNGATWVESYVPLDATSAPMTNGNLSWEANSSPVVALDKQGRAYISSLYLNVSDSANGIYVSVGTVGPTGLGLTAANTRQVVFNSDTATFLEDKPWVAVDNSSSPSSGKLYVSWTRFELDASNQPTQSRIVISSSANQGESWTTPLQINPPEHNGAVQGSQVAVGPEGEVYVVYEVFYVNNSRQHFLAKSTDGGQSFTSPVFVTPFFNELTFPSNYRKFSFASLAVGPTGHVYVVYPSQPNEEQGAEIEFVRSTTPGGTTFTSPVVINSKSAGHQFMPALTVDSAGVIHTSWFDTRRNPRRPNSLYDVFGTRSTDGGATFSPDSRFTDGQLDAGDSVFIGHYTGIAAGGGFAHPVWNTGGFNNGRLQTRTVR